MGHHHSHHVTTTSDHDTTSGHNTTPDHIQLNHHDQLAAELSKAAYSLPEDSGYQGHTSAERIEHALDQLAKANPDIPELGRMEVVSSTSDYAILRDPVTHTSHIDVRGTDLTIGQHTALRDAFNDAQIALDDQPHRVQTILQAYHEAKELYPDDTWKADGHSLGGTIAEDIGKIDPTIEVTSFDSGTTPLTGDTMGSEDHGIYNNITRHEMNNDPITGHNDDPASIIHHDAPTDAFWSHSIDNYTGPDFPSSLSTPLTSDFPSATPMTYPDPSTMGVPDIPNMADAWNVTHPSWEQSFTDSFNQPSVDYSMPSMDYSMPSYGLSPGFG